MLRALDVRARIFFSAPLRPGPRFDRFDPRRPLSARLQVSYSYIGPCVVLLCAASSSLRVAVAVLVFSGYPVRAGGQAMAVTKNELCDASGVWPARTGISAACWQGRGPVELPASFAAAETFYCCKIAHVQPLGAQSQFCVPFAVGSQSLFKLQSGNACVQL